MNGKILIIEDEEKLARFIELELSYEGYEIHKACDGREGLNMLASGEYDLLLLDIMLPGLNGMEVLRRLRRTSAIPVIMLTARDSVIDKVQGLDSGADDYITKPFAIEELLARIRAALRKKGGGDAAAAALQFEELRLDLARREASMRGVTLNLTKREFDLLHFLIVNQGVVLTRDMILERVWGYDYFGETNTVDVHIRFLRGKIDEAFDVKYIHTMRGVGYVLKRQN